uniref:Uncharacterized protein n=1 Tax=Rhinolophus ferrumequinum TaxID=59479 RepID=A0A671E186_RHIFE
MGIVELNFETPPFLPCKISKKPRLYLRVYKVSTPLTEKVPGLTSNCPQSQSCQSCLHIRGRMSTLCLNTSSGATFRFAENYSSFRKIQMK